MATLVLLRHGESAWNAADVFTGWIDVGLSERGARQAEQAGTLLAARGILPDIVHTSVQRRAIRTADIALGACGRSWVPVRRSWRLNSNHYGALQGRSKAAVRDEAGEEQYMLWRRGYRARPPLGEPDDDPRYATLPPDARPRGESLHDVTARLLPYWCDVILPDLRRYSCLLVASHGNTLRALVKHVEGITDEEVSGLNVPNACPLCYELRPGRPGRLTRIADVIRLTWEANVVARRDFSPSPADGPAGDARSMFSRSLSQTGPREAPEHEMLAFIDPAVPARACCCPARPVVRVSMPPSPARPHSVDLWLCGHHYRISQVALDAADAHVESVGDPGSQFLREPTAVAG